MDAGGRATQEAKAEAGIQGFRVLTVRQSFKFLNSESSLFDSPGMTVFFA